MKTMFRKAVTVLGSAALIGMTVGAASAASYPEPFTSNTAIVTGANAAPSDNIAASSIASNLDATSAGAAVTTLSGASGVTENEVAIGQNISTTTSGATSKIDATLTDSKIPSLIDTKISWDDGGSSGSDEYNVHEEIIVGDMSIETSITDNDFDEMLALTNDKQLEYKYVFDDAFNTSGDFGGDADDLYLTILGKEYEISAMSSTAFTVVTSEEVVLSPGESVTVEGQTFTLEDLSSTAARVNGETVTTSSKKINGLQVQVKTGSIFYNENFPEDATVTLKIGDDISKSYENGEEYVGEDEDDPQWVWTYSNPGVANGYIGVKYEFSTTEHDDDDIVYEGGSYIFPENFAEVKFEGTTDVDYEDFKIYFDDSEDLWNSTDTTSTEQTSNAKVMIIESVSGADDAIKLTTDSQETDTMYLTWADSDEGTEVDHTNGSLEVFYRDIDGTVSEVIRPRFSKQYNSTASTGTIASSDLGDLIAGDSTIAMNASVTSGGLYISFIDGDAGSMITVDVGGESLTSTTGELKWFGGTTEGTSKEAAESTDLVIESTNAGTLDNSVMTANGLIVEEPEANLENDEVMISVPTDRVYATVSVAAGGEASTSGEAGVMTVTDANVADVAGKNLVVVGGSAINSVAAELLGGDYREAAFTSATGVGAGEFLIQSFDRSGQTALLVAGYNAADTEKAVSYLLNYDVDTSVGTKMTGTSATEATVVTA